MTAMTSAQGSLDVIPADECYELLATQEVGRLGVVAAHRPMIVPVNYGVDDRTIVIRTHPGATLTAALHGAVAFEVDAIDPSARRGWSVLLSGRAQEVGAGQAPEIFERLRATGVQPWAPGDHGVWLRVIPDAISGRRIVPGQLPWGVDERAYL